MGKTVNGDVVIPVNIEVSDAYRLIKTHTESLGTYSILIPHPEILQEELALWGPVYGGTEMDDDLYERILAVDVPADIENLVDEWFEKNLIFHFFEDLFSSSEKEPIFAEKRDFIKLIGREISRFKRVLDVFKKINIALQHPENKELVENAFFSGEAAGMGAAFDPCDRESLTDRINIVFYDQINQYVGVREWDIEDHELFGISVSQGKLCRKDIIEKLLANQYYITTNDYAQLFVARFINPQLIGIEIRSTDDGISFHCPTILSSLYQKMVISNNEGVLYRKCNHKQCERYFRVNSQHPQSMCDVHMKPRRKKRENQRSYKKHK